MSKKNIYLLIIVLTVVITLSTIYFGVNRNNNEEKITTYELQTHEYHEYYGSEKFVINSINELITFNEIYSDTLSNKLIEIYNIDEKYLKNNTIFIEVHTVSSGSIGMQLKKVSFADDEVSFVIDRTVPEVGTMDMATWYLVAMIPNSKLKNINIDDWAIPSDIYSTMVKPN